MQTTTLGRSGLRISRLALGGLFAAASTDTLDEARRVFARAAELGITHVDTAPTYGASEEVLGKVLAGLPKGTFTISSKLGGRPQPFLPRDPACLRTSVEQSLQLLGVDHLDVLLVHEPDRTQQYDWWSDWNRVEGPVLEVLDQLKRAGTVRSTGLGGTTTTQLAHLCASGKFDVVLSAYQHSLLFREAAIEALPAARRAGMGVMLGSPLQQGALSRRYQAVDDPSVTWLSAPRREQLRQLYQLVERSGLGLPELGLRFALSTPLADCVLVGVQSVAELETNVAAVEKGPLPADLLRDLDRIAALVPFRPYGEPFGLGWILPWPGSFAGLGSA